MAGVIYHDPVREVHGAVEKHGEIYRRKYYRDENGKLIGVGKKEVYMVANPRDWKKNPPKGGELDKINRFREACNRAYAILKTANPANNPTPEEVAAYNDYKARFKAQIDGQPDPQAPKEPATNLPRRYLRLDNFIRAIILNQLKNA